jgi:hypothetical protein
METLDPTLNVKRAKLGVDAVEETIEVLPPTYIHSPYARQAYSTQTSEWGTPAQADPNATS